MITKKNRDALKKYIRKAIKNGFSEKNIKDKLIETGYDDIIIDQMFKEVHTSSGFFNKKVRVKIENKPTEEEKSEDIKPQILEKKGIRGEIKQINEKLDQISTLDKKKEQKEFGLPGKVKRNLKKLALKNKLLVFYLTKNRTIKPIITKIEGDFVIIDGLPHNISLDFVFMWKGKYPAIVLPEWDLNPIGTQNYQDALKDGRDPYTVAKTIKMLEEGKDLTGKKKMGWKAAVGIGIAAIVIGYIFFGGA